MTIGLTLLLALTAAALPAQIEVPDRGDESRLAQVAERGLRTRHVDPAAVQVRNARLVLYEDLGGRLHFGLCGESAGYEGAQWQPFSVWMMRGAAVWAEDGLQGMCNHGERDRRDLSEFLKRMLRYRDH